MMARVTPEHDPEDPRYVLQGHVGVVTQSIPAGAAGVLAFDDGTGERTMPARSIDDEPVEAGWRSASNGSTTAWRGWSRGRAWKRGSSWHALRSEAGPSSPPVK
jgi:hypothetical protein